MNEKGADAMKVIIYGCKSTEDRHASIPDQIDDCRRLAEREGWEVIGEPHTDEAFSGYHGNRGPGLEQAKQAAAAAAAEHGQCVLLAQDSDRFARGAGDKPGAADHLGEIFFAMRRQGVDLWTVRTGHLDTVRAVLDGDRATEESARKSTAVAKGMRRRAERGAWVGGHPPYGYRHRDLRRPDPDDDPDKPGIPTGPLVIVDQEAEVVRRVFTEYASGRGQRAIVRALNDDRVPTATGGRWQQSRITRMLSNPAYAGKVVAKDADGARTIVIEGKHDAIVSDELWSRVQAVRAGGSRRTGGRHADGAHLLVRGILRCSCGSAMLPRKARPGVERERYVCRGRVEHGPEFCSQPSIRREKIDEPFLATMLDSYVDLEATRRRIQERASSALTCAREALDQAERDAASAEAKLARVRGHYQAGKIEADDWSEQRRQLTAELEAAREAAQRAREHVRRVEQNGVTGDGEQALLEHLAALKRAVGEGVGSAPDLNALRNTIGDMFASIDLVRNDDDSYLLMPTLRVCRLDDRRSDFDAAGRRQELLVGGAETLSPTGQETPSPPEQSYPFTFLARYCWWWLSA
jgi:DNA invertase Pin-like site-specific DNA recombinase